MSNFNEGNEWKNTMIALGIYAISNIIVNVPSMYLQEEGLLYTDSISYRYLGIQTFFIVIMFFIGAITDILFHETREKQQAKFEENTDENLKVPMYFSVHPFHHDNEDSKVSIQQVVRSLLETLTVTIKTEFTEKFSKESFFYIKANNTHRIVSIYLLGIPTTLLIILSSDRTGLGYFLEKSIENLIGDFVHGGDVLFLLVLILYFVFARMFHRWYKQKIEFDVSHYIEALLVRYEDTGIRIESLKEKKRQQKKEIKEYQERIKVLEGEFAAKKSAQTFDGTDEKLLEFLAFLESEKTNIPWIISRIPPFRVSHLIEEADRIRTMLEELEERLRTQQIIVDLTNHNITQEGLANEIDSQKKRIDQMIEEEKQIIENGKERILQEAEAIEAKIQKGLDEIQRSETIFSDFRSILVYIKAPDLRDETKKIHLEIKQREKEYAEWKEILETYQVHVINETSRVDNIEVWINRLDAYIAQDLNKTSVSLPGMIWKKTANLPPIYSDEHIIQRACVHIEERIQSLLNRQANHFLDELEKFLVKFKTFSDLYGETLRLSSQNGKGVLNLVEPFIGSEASGIDGTESQSDMYYITTEDRLKHTYCIGTTGCGKSKLLESLIIQDLFQGRGGCLLDPFGGLFRDIMAFILFYEDMRNDALSLQKEVREFLEYHALNVNIYEFGDEEKIPVFVENAEQRGVLESIRNADIETSLPPLNYKAIDISDKTNQETENPYRINPFQKEEEEHVEDICFYPAVNEHFRQFFA